MNRRSRCLILVSGIIFSLVIPLGCSDNRDHEPLKELLAALAEAAKDDYQDEIKKYPREEWAVRRGVLTSRRDLKIIEDFIQKSRNLTANGRDAVESLRETCRKRTQLLEGVVSAGRFKLTETEKEEESKRMNEHLRRVTEIGRIIDGKSD